MISTLPESDNRDRQGARPEPTDMHSLRRALTGAERRYQPRSVTDLLVDALTPLMIFVMVWSAIFFLLDVRFMYTEEHDLNLRMVAFCFVMGIVALNRLIVRDGKEESVLYIFGLAMAIGLYTIGISMQTQSVAVGIIDKPFVSAGFNIALVISIWWGANRLTHECCVDESPEAADIGLLAGTRRRIRRAWKRESVFRFKKHEPQPVILQTEIEPFDPLERQKPGKKKAQAPAPATKRLPKRHPGISVFYFSVPAMLVFALGQRILQNGGQSMVRAGNFFVCAYTVAALMLLMLSSLGGLREYFRSRRITIPAGIGPFWIGLGAVMVAVVLVGASWLPMPGRPHTIVVVKQSAYEDSLQYDENSRNRSKTGDKDPSETRQEGERSETPNAQDSDSPKSRARRATKEKVSQMEPVLAFFDKMQLAKIAYAVVGIFVVVFLIFGLLQVLSFLAALGSRDGDHSIGILGRIFRLLERLLRSMTRVPTLAERRVPRRIQRDVSLSQRYANPLQDAALKARMSPRELVEYSYTALCAFAHDMAVPREPGQTPYEFIRSFPEPLDTLRDVATDLTNLYVFSSYTDETEDEAVAEAVENILHRFWHAFDKVRARVIR